MTNSHIACRLSVVGKTMRDLHAAVTERMERDECHPISYEGLSRALNGGTEPKQKKAVSIADTITMRWLDDYANTTAQSLAPRLKKRGIPHKDLTGSVMPTADFTVIVTIKSGGEPVATYRPASNQIGDIRGGYVGDHDQRLRRMP